MDVTNGEFYHVEIDGGESIFQSQEEAIEYLGERKDSIDMDDPDVALATVETGEEWSIKEVPWRNIALQLL